LNFIEPDACEAGLKAGFAGQLAAFAQLARTGALAAPAQNLEGALLTMRLAERLAQGALPLG